MKYEACWVSFCNGLLSVVHRPCVRASVRASTISLNNICSETAYWIIIIIIIIILVSE